jgi:hypothetical protein
MNLFQQLFLAVLARRDAANHVSAGDDHITVAQGLPPRFDPTGNLRHARLARDLNNRGESEELAEDVRRTEAELAEHPSPAGLLFVLVFLFAAEVMGSVFVVRAVGYENPERLVLGAMLAAFIFFITALAAQNEPSAAAAGGTQAPTRRSPWYVLVLAAYGVLVLSITVIRVGEAGSGDETSRLSQFAAGAVMLFATVGPAAVAELIMRRRAPGVRLMNRLRQLRRRLRDALRAHARAEKEIEQIATGGERWEDSAARRRALYQLEHRTADAQRRPAAGAPSNES